MKISLYPTPAALKQTTFDGALAVVIDVLRASTTIATALANGCAEIIPTAEVQEALKVAARLPRNSYLLCGERLGKKIDGFDLGNSPLEYAPERVQGKTIILTTTNGTRALLSCRTAELTLVLALINLNAVAEFVLARQMDVHVVCSGTNGKPSLEDSVCAGLLVDFLHKQSPSSSVLNESARASIKLAHRWQNNLLAMLHASPHGQYLVRTGFENDLAFAAQFDALTVVPIFGKGVIKRA